MSSPLLRRSVAAASGAMLLAMLLAPSATLASTPGWIMTVTTNPSASSQTDPSHVSVRLSPHAAFAVSVTITNSGKSNIAKLYLEDDTPMTGAYALYAASPSCNATGPLFCNLGSLSKGKSVSVALVYKTVTGDKPLGIFANTSGVSSSDGGTSHGDVLPGQVKTQYDSSAGFAGGYVIDASQPIGTTGGNQQTSILPPTDNIGVTIQQQNATGATACGTSGFGQLAVTNVGNGATFVPFKTVLTYSTSLIGNETEIGAVSVCHTYDIGHTPAKLSITQACNSLTAPTNAPCINARFEGQTGNDDIYWSWWRGWYQAPLDADDFTTLVIDVWDTNNGGFRGAS